MNDYEQGQIDALMSAAKDWDAEYQRLTKEHGSYGQLKVRAAYRLASAMAENRAMDLRMGAA